MFTTTASITIDQLLVQSDLEELARLCQQIDKTCRIMYELSQHRPDLAAEQEALRSGLLNERRAGLRDLVQQFGATSTRLCK